MESKKVQEVVVAPGVPAEGGAEDPGRGGHQMENYKTFFKPKFKSESGNQCPDSIEEGNKVANCKKSDLEATKDKG